MLEIILDDRGGKLWNISQLVTQISWKTSRKGKAGSLDMTFIKGSVGQDRNFNCTPGNILRVKVKGFNLFYGYIFAIDSSDKETVKIMAYDQIRYLMNKDVSAFEDATATEIIKGIAEKFNIRVGELADTVHRIPSMLEDNKQLIDTIIKALDETLTATEEIFILYDDFGSLTLRNAKDMIVAHSVGEGSQLMSYSHKISIDSDTFNYMKFVQDNKKTGKRDVYVLKDSGNVAKWGQLQFYRVVDEKMNKAQIEELIDNVMRMKNRETRTLSVDAFGDLTVRAGCYVHINIEELEMSQLFIVNECTHDFDGNEHKMKLQLEVYSRVDRGPDQKDQQYYTYRI
ncbi:hypothetical protein PAECIP111893_03517 [Paenibacillus plantiphilus]|uniref:YqbQ/XkdQ domain-containing protein n=2 Tax=Paenibacillus plantiphilus TaxID=2905650 RepID=A0ABM9CHP2_9BACL|nr:hypothetical protein PAECIP111893_03517 [Paenibacillus plantiphilus]